MPKKTIDQKIDALARMTQRGFFAVDKKFSGRFDGLHGQIDWLRRDAATKEDLKILRGEIRDTSEHLLDAIRGIEVKKRDFEALVDVVEELRDRVAVLEKRR